MFDIKASAQAIMPGDNPIQRRLQRLQIGFALDMQAEGQIVGQRAFGVDQNCRGDFALRFGHRNLPPAC